jgi:hypothetical protein
MRFYTGFWPGFGQQKEQLWTLIHNQSITSSTAKDKYTIIKTIVSIEVVSNTFQIHLWQAIPQIPTTLKQLAADQNPECWP